MRKRVVTAVAGSAVLALALTACGGGSDSGSGESSGSKDGKKITVWLMPDEFGDKTLDAVNKQFKDKTGADVKIEIQQWSGVSTKITTALSTNNPPDVVEMGNTQVALYAENGALMDLSDHKKDLSGGATWLKGLEDPATIDGALYAVPAFAGDRAVIYNKDMWQAAGVTEEPKTWEEFTAALDKVKAANAATEGFSALYLPGKMWHASLSFLWDTGGDVAKKSGDKWEGTMSSPKSIEGLKNYKEFFDTYSTPAAAATDELKPDFNQLMADGKTSAILNTSGNNILAANKDVKLGSFAMPSKAKDGETMPVLLGGSDWGVPAKSSNQDLAIEWLKIAAGQKIQEDYVFGQDKWIPNSEQAVKEAQKKGLAEDQKGPFAASLNSRSTPASAGWAAVESNLLLENFYASITTGNATIEDATKSLDKQLTEALNGNGQS